jgi:hypothetical protein
MLELDKEQGQTSNKPDVEKFIHSQFDFNIAVIGEVVPPPKSS